MLGAAQPMSQDQWPEVRAPLKRCMEVNGCWTEGWLDVWPQEVDEPTAINATVFKAAMLCIGHQCNSELYKGSRTRDGRHVLIAYTVDGESEKQYVARVQYFVRISDGVTTRRFAICRFYNATMRDDRDTGLVFDARLDDFSHTNYAVPLESIKQAMHTHTRLVAGCTHIAFVPVTGTSRKVLYNA